MIDTDVIDMLGEIGRSGVARLSQANTLPGQDAPSRRSQILRAIRGTVLPRKLELTSGNGDRLVIEVSSSRVTDVLETSVGGAPDFEVEARESATEKLAQLISDFSTAPGPLELVSSQLDTAPDADDVGITLSEIERACTVITLPVEPKISIVTKAAQDTGASAPPATTLAAGFFAGAGSFAAGRILVDDQGAGALDADGACGTDAALDPGAKVLTQFMRDLAAWDKDSADAMSLPQLVVMRPTGGASQGLALFRDGDATACAVHEPRKLGAVVSLWKSLLRAGTLDEPAGS